MILEACKSMVKENNFCVLSTTKDNLTNSSLMLYLSEADGTRLYMITLKGSTKYFNMEENPEVSLLIDTREHMLVPEAQVKALTVYGRATLINDTQRGLEIIEKLVERHPSLRTLAELEEASVVQVDVRSFLYLDGVNDAERVTIEA